MPPPRFAARSIVDPGRPSRPSASDLSLLRREPNCHVPLPADDLSFLSRSSSPVKKPWTRTCPSPRPRSTVGDLQSLAASHIDSLKSRLDALHRAAVRDLEASRYRITKPFSLLSRFFGMMSSPCMRTQGCLQFEEEADKEHKKMTDKINERTEVVKVSKDRNMAVK
ncbi:hypothetical protein EJB05_24859, partial [Eragrostis curvula]